MAKTPIDLQLAAGCGQTAEAQQAGRLSAPARQPMVSQRIAVLEQEPGQSPVPSPLSGPPRPRPASSFACRTAPGAHWKGGWRCRAPALLRIRLPASSDHGGVPVPGLLAPVMERPSRSVKHDHSGIISELLTGETKGRAGFSYSRVCHRGHPARTALPFPDYRRLSALHSPRRPAAVQ